MRSVKGPRADLPSLEWTLYLCLGHDRDLIPRFFPIDSRCLSHHHTRPIWRRQFENTCERQCATLIHVSSWFRVPRWESARLLNLACSGPCSRTGFSPGSDWCTPFTFFQHPLSRVLLLWRYSPPSSTSSPATSVQSVLPGCGRGHPFFISMKLGRI